jgi:glyoxylase-like metal-dependent hydrolase (beta-lactamase superfamily II)
LADRHAWISAGAHPVAAGVYRIPLPLPTDGLRAVNVYAIEADSGLVLIDSGWALARARDQLEQSLAAIGAGLPDVRKFLVTHLHRDHYTQAIEIRRLFGTPVALGAEEKHSINRLLGPEYRPLGAQLTMLGIAGAAHVGAELMAGRTTRPPAGLPGGAADPPDGAGGLPGGAADPPDGQTRLPDGAMTLPDHPDLLPGATFAAAMGYETPDEWIAAGQEFDLGTRTLTAIPTPGHTRGHVVFADAEAGLLFAGDHVLPHITPSLAFEECPPELPLREYLRSLAVVRKLPDMRLLPAHGPVSPSTHARVDELTEHHASRLAAMAEVLTGGQSSPDGHSAYEVAQAVPWTSRQRKLTDLDAMNQMLAIGETVYHLDLLVAQSAAVSRTGDDGVRRYRPADPPGEEATQ